MRQIPNPHSKTLKDAVIGGAGFGKLPVTDVPEDMGAVLLYVPIEHVNEKISMDIQNDIGLPWHVNGGQPVWFKEPQAAVVPNPSSSILKNAIIGGAGLAIPPDLEVPANKATIVLYVPVEHINDKLAEDIQTDMGLPWYELGTGEGSWFN